MSVNEGMYEDFYARIGLDLSQLKTGFANAGMTIEQNIRRLNHESNLIRLRTEVEISGLDEVADAEKILEVRTNALNKQIEIQRDRAKLLEYQLQHLTQAHGAESSEAQRTAIRLERARLSMSNLEQELRELNSTQQKATGGLSSLSGIIDKLPPQLKDVASGISSIATAGGKTVATLAAISLAFKGMKTFADLAKEGIAAGDAFYVMSRGFQMNFADTARFVNMCNIAGAEVNEVAMAVKRAQQQIVKGGADSKGAEELRRYGESAYDASGHLKNLNEMVLTFNRAMKKAQAEGREAEFVLRTFRNASGDVITTLEDAAANYEAADKIVRGGLSDPALAHNVQGLINELNTQTGKLKANFSVALLPAAEELVPKLTERMKDLASVVRDNKNVIREFGRDVGEILLAMESGAEKVFGAFGTLMKAAYDLKKSPYQDELVERFKNDLDINSVDDLIKKAQPKAYDVIKNNSLLYAQVKAKYLPIYQALADVQAEIKAKQEEVDETIETLSGETLKYQAETKAIMEKSNLNDYQKRIYDVRAWETELLQESEKTESEKLAIRNLANAKIFQAEQELAAKLKEIRESVMAADKTALENKLAAIEKERQAWVKAGMEEAESVELAQRKRTEARLKAWKESEAKIQEHYRNAADIEYELTHTAFEKQIRDIEQWRDAKIKAGEDAAAIIAESAAKEAQAFEREVDRIKGLTQSLDDKIFELDHSQYESDIRRIQQEYMRQAQEYADAGLLPVMKGKLDYLYMRQKQKLDTRATESREKGGDYAKSPTGLPSWNGLPMVQRGISLMTNENTIRNQLISTLDAEAKAAVTRTQSIKDMLPAMPSIAEQLSSASLGDKTIIHGDEITQISTSDLQAEMKKMGLTAMQLPEMNLRSSMPTTIETVVTPLNSISNAVDSILSELRNRQPAQINVSPNQHINLGGAYVFDNAMRKSLVDDITSRIVDEITSAVRQATSQANFSYSS